MRWSWLRAALLGLVIGPAPAAVEPGAAKPLEAERLAAGKTAGHAVPGSGFYVWDEDAREAEEWALELLERSAGEVDQSAPWRVIAARTAARPSLLMDEDESKLAAGIEGSSWEGGISPLGLLLCLLPSLDRTCLISSCAASSHEPMRLALARALAAPFEAVGVRAVLDHLQNDPSAEVRRSARSAAAVRHISLG
jgi:hypothetical protein